MRILCRLSDLAGTGAKEVIVEDAGLRHAVFVVRCGQDVAAYFNACPHARLPLNGVPDTFLDVTGSYLVCVNHGAHFDPRTGRCIRGPCKGQSLKPLAVRCEDGGILCMEDDYTPVTARGG